MRIKHSVKPIGIKPELSLGLLAANSAYEELGYEMVITSITDSEHKATHSSHYTGNAADLRTRKVPEEKHQLLLELIKSKLNNQYTVILESNHIHLSFKPVYL